MNLSQAIPLPLIHAPLVASDDDAALSILVQSVSDALDLEDPAEVHDRLLYEPVLRAALVGHGAAIIHSRIDGLTRSVAALGVAPQGRSFRIGGTFQYVVGVIFLVVSPPEPPEPHLELVSAIAGFVRDDESMRRLVQAESPAAAADALSSHS